MKTSLDCRTLAVNPVGPWVSVHPFSPRSGMVVRRPVSNKCASSCCCCWPQRACRTKLHCSGKLRLQLLPSSHPYFIKKVCLLSGFLARWSKSLRTWAMCFENSSATAKAASGVPQSLTKNLRVWPDWANDITVLWTLMKADLGAKGGFSTGGEISSGGETKGGFSEGGSSTAEGSPCSSVGFSAARRIRATSWAVNGPGSSSAAIAAASTDIFQIQEKSRYLTKMSPPIYHPSIYLSIYRSVSSAYLSFNCPCCVGCMVWPVKKTSWSDWFWDFGSKNILSANKIQRLEKRIVQEITSVLFVFSVTSGAVDPKKHSRKNDQQYVCIHVFVGNPSQIFCLSTYLST